MVKGKLVWMAWERERELNAWYTNTFKGKLDNTHIEEHVLFVLLKIGLYDISVLWEVWTKIMQTINISLKF